MRILILTAFCFCCTVCFAQTKLISYRSHSGSTQTFRKAIENDMFDISESNFGLQVNYFYKIDTVILMSNNKIMIVKRAYAIVTPSQRVYHKVCSKDIVTKAHYSNLFRANDIGNLKIEINKIYKTYKLDSTLFIGFDKKFKVKKG